MLQRPEMPGRLIVAHQRDEADRGAELEQVAADQRRPAQRGLHLLLAGGDGRRLRGEADGGAVGVEVDDGVADQEHPGVGKLLDDLRQAQRRSPLAAGPSIPGPRRAFAPGLLQV